MSAQIIPMAVIISAPTLLDHTPVPATQDIDLLLMEEGVSLLRFLFIMNSQLCAKIFWVIISCMSAYYTGDDIDECTGSNICQQVCTNTEGSFTCGCKAGYVLDSEGATCSGKRILCLLCAFHLVMFSQESPVLNLLSAVISLAMG